MEGHLYLRYKLKISSLVAGLKIQGGVRTEGSDIPGTTAPHNGNRMYIIFKKKKKISLG